jgi:hypothetical protein
MDNNLPKDDSNQKPEILIDPPEPTVSLPEETTETTVPPMPAIPETPTIPTENFPIENTSILETEETKTETTEIKEQPIQIGALDQSSSTSFNQAINPDNSNPSKPKKSKKIKTISSVLGILLIIAALPISMLLVKQRQEIRKEAASGTVTVCGVTVSAAGNEWNGNTYTGIYSLNNTSGKNVEMTIRVDGCACDDGNVGQCNDNCNGENRTFTLSPGTRTERITTPSKDNCGTFQTDIKVMSCRQL